MKRLSSRFLPLFALATLVTACEPNGTNPIFDKPEPVAAPRRRPGPITEEREAEIAKHREAEKARQNRIAEAKAARSKRSVRVQETRALRAVPRTQSGNGTYAPVRKDFVVHSKLAPEMKPDEAMDLIFTGYQADELFKDAKELPPLKARLEIEEVAGVAKDSSERPHHGILTLTYQGGELGRKFVKEYDSDPKIPLVLRAVGPEDTLTGELQSVDGTVLKLDLRRVGAENDRELSLNAFRGSLQVVFQLNTLNAVSLGTMDGFLAPYRPEKFHSRY